MEALNLSPELKKRTVLMGFGEMKPLAPNRDPSGKAIPNNQKKNRRVTVRIF
jgi:chemotaxis protein MotB